MYPVASVLAVLFLTFLSTCHCARVTLTTGLTGTFLDKGKKKNGTHAGNERAEESNRQPKCNGFRVIATLTCLYGGATMHLLCYHSRTPSSHIFSCDLSTISKKCSYKHTGSHHLPKIQEKTGGKLAHLFALT